MSHHTIGVPLFLISNYIIVCILCCCVSHYVMFMSNVVVYIPSCDIVLLFMSYHVAHLIVLLFILYDQYLFLFNGIVVCCPIILIVVSLQLRFCLLFHHIVVSCDCTDMNSTINN